MDAATLLEEHAARYRYHSTVVVTGNLKKYVSHLERYFRERACMLQADVDHFAKKVRSLERDIESFEEEEDTTDLPFSRVWGDPGLKKEVNDHNYREILSELKQLKSLSGKVHRLQRINHGKILGILLDEQPLSALDLTSLDHSGHIVKIQYVAQPQDSIRMRIYAKQHPTQWSEDAESEYPHRVSESIMSDAKKIGVMASVVEEESIENHNRTIDDLLASSEIRKSKLRVHPPEFEFELNGDRIHYSCHLSDAELEMLRLVSGTVRRTDWLCYDSPSWSPGQARKLVRNLLGILSVDSPAYNREHPYLSVGVDERNTDAVKEAMNTGIFKNSVLAKSLSALAVVYHRTIELKQQYGQGFYPRFTVTEVFKLGRLRPMTTRKALHDLTGILARANEPCIVWKGDASRTTQHIKWFIPKSRMNLIWRLVGKRESRISTCPSDF